jgi:hypothetical protein
MERQIIRKTLGEIDFKSEAGPYHSEVDRIEVTELMRQIEALTNGASGVIKLEIGSCYECCPELRVVVERPEPEATYRKRVATIKAKIKKQEERRKQDRRKQYEELKREFGDASA